ncbi:MAG: prephenate dehydratase [Dehalococcoidia bacterium]|nr:prephenate dehydratase [Dehalococcoidia bacterium]HRC62123.1 prephenate dehydratase [Dehalococcoidia bacterium]
MRLAHLGPRGTYTEAAALAFAPDAELMPVATVTAAVAAVEAGQADAAVCAIENAIDGSINETIDLLLREDGHLHVRGEVVLAIHHALVGPPGLDVSAATVVYSHPSALGQCRRRLAEFAPNARAVAALSTAAAIESSMKETGALAVGNRLSAELYQATIYAEDIADEPGNETRFVVLGHEDAARTGNDKTSIAFTTHHDRPGSLVEVLGIFSRRGINLTRIESRPTRRALGTYVFLVDLLGHRDDPPVAEAIEEARGVTLWMRVLGSYPRWLGTRA